MGEFVLLLCDVVGLQRCRGDLHGVGEDLLALLDLPDFVGDGSLFVLDLRDGVTRLCRIEDDSGTELCICERLQRRKPNGEHRKGKFLHLSHPFVAVGLVMLYSGTALLLCSENLLLELRETVGLWLAPCLAFFLLSF